MATKQLGFETAEEIRRGRGTPEKNKPIIGRIKKKDKMLLISLGQLLGRS